MRIWITMAALSFLPATPAFAQATLQTYTDKAAFLAATAATGAGPLPNLGCVTGGASLTAGSVTFRAGPGGDDVCVGAAGTGAAPDWYSPTPGNDIAQGVESLDVRTATLVSSLGFDFVEPRATIPAWGGMPVNSMFQVTLYNGATRVGQFNFDVPDDVVTFIGVHSSLPFNRAVIIDTTGNDDDEYFGQFYTGTAPGATRTFVSAARTGGAIPGGAGSFTGFPQAPVGSAGAIGFFGLGTGSQQGLYTCATARPVDPCRPIAALSTPIPGGTGTFTGFGDLALAPGRAAFLGTGVAQQGVYGCLTAGPVEPCRRIADLTTPIPGGTGTFRGFARVAAGGSITSFLSTGAGQAGVYNCVSSAPTEPCRRVADLTTPIPGGTGTFIGFSQVSTSGLSTSFLGTGAGQAGVYNCDAAIPIDPCDPVANLTTAIPDGTGTFTGFSQVSTSGSITSFMGTGAGQAGVYNCDSATPIEPCTRVADLTTAIPEGTGRFIGFGAISASAGHVAFLGLGGGGQVGIYLASGLTKVIAAGDTIEGKVVTALRLGQLGLDNGSLTFAATFADGSQGVYHATIPSGASALSFARFEATAAIDIRNRAFAVAGAFTLGASSNGIAPLTETVRLRVGIFQESIPAGSFRPNGFGGFQFRGVRNGVNLIMVVQRLVGQRYAFSAVGWDVNLTGTANPVTIQLSVGDDGGSDAVSAFFGFVPHGSL